MKSHDRLSPHFSSQESRGHSLGETICKGGSPNENTRVSGFETRVGGRRTGTAKSGGRSAAAIYARQRPCRSRGLNGSHPGEAGSPIDRGEGVPGSVSNRGGAMACSTAAPTPVFTGLFARVSVPAPTCKSQVQVGEIGDCKDRAKNRSLSNHKSQVFARQLDKALLNCLAQ